MKAARIFLIIFIVYLGSSCVAGAQDGQKQLTDQKRVYINGGIGCTSEQYAKTAIGADTEIVLALFRKGVCFALDSGQTAELEYISPSDSHSRRFAKIRVQGDIRDIWTNRESISNDGPIKGAMREVPNVGLGCTLDDIENAWNKGYRHVSSEIGMVRVGISEESAISYYINDAFGDPKRAGAIDGGARGLFGAQSGQQATARQFFTGITRLMPQDSKLVCAYRSKDRSEEIYVFKSEWLKSLPGLGECTEYKQNEFYPEDRPPALGTFFLDVHYQRDNPDHVALFKINVGRISQDILTQIGMLQISHPTFASIK
jgi:hypothetical protein